MLFVDVAHNVYDVVARERGNVFPNLVVARVLAAIMDCQFGPFWIGLWGKDQPTEIRGGCLTGARLIEHHGDRASLTGRDPSLPFIVVRFAINNIILIP